MLRSSLVPEHALVDPHSVYMKWWDLVIGICLVYVGIVTPYEVVFVGTLAPSDWLFLVNRVVDLVSLMDMILQFFLKVEVCAERMYGRSVLRDPMTIALRYLTSWFVIDLVGVFPFDLLFLFGGSSDSVRGVKFFRMVRLLRLFKLIRVVRASRLLDTWQDYIPLSFASQKLVRFVVSLCAASHWMACFWGLVGLSLGVELCDSGGNRRDFEEPTPLSDISWLVLVFSGGKPGSDDPCNPFHVYAISLHWAVMTITSIGYGDIFPVRNEEYWACLLCMLLGGILWSSIIGGTCAIIANGDPVQEHFETHTDLLTKVMKEQGLKAKTAADYRRYLRSAKVRLQVEHFRELSKTFSPKLKGELLGKVSGHWMAHVYYLGRASAPSIALILDALDLRFFNQREHMAVTSENLCVADRGSVAWGGRIFAAGMVFQMDFIVEQPCYRRCAEAVSLSFALVFVLHRDNFFKAIEGQTELVQDVKRAAVRFALRRVLQMCVRDASPTSSHPNLMDAFDKVHVQRSGYSYSFRHRSNSMASTNHAVTTLTGDDSSISGEASLRCISSVDDEAVLDARLTSSIRSVQPGRRPRRVSFIGARSEPIPEGGRGGGARQRLEELEAGVAAALTAIRRLRTALPRNEAEDELPAELQRMERVVV